MTDLFEHSVAVSLAPAKQIDESAFARFQAAYPKRDGGQKWPVAEKKFRALVKSGVDPERIISGAERFAKQMQQKGSIGTEFVPMAATWINQQLYSDEPIVEASEPAESAAFWEDVISAWKRLKRWSKHAGPEPGCVGCRCPRELLAKHGL